MKKIAITGNIASGKSTAQKILQGKGYKVLDTDEAAHELLTAKNKELFDAFQNYDVFENGEFSREKMGQLIFSNPDLKKRLESILHPLIAQKIEEFFEQYRDENLVFVGIPLLFEAKMENLFDKIIFIYTDDDIRLERLMKRNNFSLEYAKSRLSSQMPQDEKMRKSTHVILNNGSIKELEKSILTLV